MTWADIPGSESKVSSDGQVRGARGGILKGHFCGGPYRRVQIVRDGRVIKNAKVHHLVAEAFLGPRPEGLDIRHLDGDPLNNRADNLAYGTRSENIQDTVRHGTHSYAKRTRCGKGHRYTAANTYIRPNGARKCRTCERVRSRKRNANKKVVR